MLILNYLFTAFEGHSIKTFLHTLWGF